MHRHGGGPSSDDDLPRGFRGLRALPTLRARIDRETIFECLPKVRADDPNHHAARVPRKGEPTAASASGPEIGADPKPGYARLAGEEGAVVRTAILVAPASGRRYEEGTESRPTEGTTRRV